MCVGIAAASVAPAAYDLWKVVAIAVAQLQGPAFPTDFLNLYAGAFLLTHTPELTYRLDEQLAVQRALTGTASQLVPFYLPPYAALLVGWLGWLPYGVAYLVWLAMGVASVVLAIYWIAPRWTRWYVLIWFGLSLLFLPVVLSLGQGQTSALLLLATALLVRGFTHAREPRLGLVASTVVWLLKPQLAPIVLAALLLSRRGRALLTSGVVVGAVGVIALVRLGQDGTTQYALVAQQKTHEALSADPAFLIGPTLLHASHWFVGVNDAANIVAAALIAAAIGVALYVWRRGPAADESLYLQLALVPIVAVICAPYALIYEVTPWLVSFWLVLRYTQGRSVARAGFFWLVGPVWAAASVGVAAPLAGGADVAALLGLCLAGFIAWLFARHDAAHTTSTCPSSRNR
jgi:hypothetical protein